MKKVGPKANPLPYEFTENGRARGAAAFLLRAIPNRMLPGPAFRPTID
jgi:hypothetical protein